MKKKLKPHTQPGDFSAVDAWIPTGPEADEYLVDLGYDLSEYSDISLVPESEEINYKFNEGQLIQEFKNYIDSTYSGHYSKDKFQATEFIIDGGHGTGFCVGNVLKYAQRYGKKGTSADARKDLMKVLHYALIQLYIHDNYES